MAAIRFYGKEMSVTISREPVWMKYYIHLKSGDVIMNGDEVLAHIDTGFGISPIEQDGRISMWVDVPKSVVGTKYDESKHRTVRRAMIKRVM